MPPFAPHPADPVRGVLAALALRAELAAAGVRASVGVTSGPVGREPQLWMYGPTNSVSVLSCFCICFKLLLYLF